MKKNSLLFVFSLILSGCFIFSCQSEKKISIDLAPEYFLEVPSTHDLNIHIRHFKTEGVKQSVSSWVFSQIETDSQNYYTPDETFVKHHFRNDIKTGVCDNTVDFIDKKTGKLYFRCGGHAQTVR